MTSAGQNFRQMTKKSVEPYTKEPQLEKRFTLKALKKLILFILMVYTTHYS